MVGLRFLMSIGIMSVRHRDGWMGVGQYDGETGVRPSVNGKFC